ncbi:MAG: hypothetical protein PWR21_1063 [Methanoculleus sp.]|nr:hypothetical protein [Methanoculleus sp.]
MLTGQDINFMSTQPLFPGFRRNHTFLSLSGHEEIERALERGKGRGAGSFTPRA